MSLNTRGVKPITYNERVASKEYLAGGLFLDANQLAVLRHQTADEITRRFGDDKIREMMRDPEIQKSLMVIKIGVLDNPIRFYPAVHKPVALRGIEDPHTHVEAHSFSECDECRVRIEDDIAEYEEAKKYADFLNRSLKELEKSIERTLWAMLDGVYFGNKVAEKVFEEVYDKELDRNVFIVRSFRVKRRTSIEFVVDRFSKLLGIRGATYIGQKKVTKTIPVEKFMIFTHDERDEDPRGTSKLEAVYNAWWLKRQVFPEYLTWLKQCSIPQLVGILPEGATREPLINKDTGLPVEDENGNPVYLDAAGDMLTQLKKARNATALVVPYGSDVKPIVTNVTGDPFKGMIDALNGEMEMGLLLQTLATSDSRNNTRAASQTHITVLDNYLSVLKQQILDMVLHQYARQLLEINFPDFNPELLPRITAGDGNRRDWHKDVAALAALYNAGYLSESQLAATDAWIGLRDREEASLGQKRTEQPNNTNTVRQEEPPHEHDEDDDDSEESRSDTQDTN